MSLRAAQMPRLRHGRGGHIFDVEEPTPCAEDPEMWFPVGTSWDGHAAQAALAKAACRTCPIVADCLAWALDTREPYAIAGATTPRERTKILNRPGAATSACGTRKGYERHRRRGEKPCDRCRNAARIYSQQRRQAAAS